jgi:hypothetical protein
MNYTENYKQIYAAISKSKLPHEKIHKAALRITDALNDIFVYTNMQFPSMMDEIMDIVEQFTATVKLGGYDLDDRD